MRLSPLLPPFATFAELRWDGVQKGMQLEDCQHSIISETVEGKFVNFPEEELQEVIAQMKSGATQYFKFKTGINKNKKYRFTKLAEDGTFEMKLDELV